jgi:phosphoglycolate phosphatase
MNMSGRRSALPLPLETLGTAVEIHTDFDRPPGKIRHALLDFDGTISLLRAGWQEVMIDQFVEVLCATHTNETEPELTDVCQSFITRMTGRQTIYQMLQLEEEVIKRGGEPYPAAAYKKDYLERLTRHIGVRIEAVRQMQRSHQPPVDHMVRGALNLLEGLKAAGIRCYLASGTDLEFVLEEAELLGVSQYFQDGDGQLHIYGALEEYRKFSKKMIIERILTENRLSGPELVVFGDGYVELENALAFNGVAIGVASVETGAEGWDLWKKDRLQEVGAHVLVPDWQECDLLFDYLGIR